MKKLSRIRGSVMTILLVLFLAVIVPMYLLGYGIYQWGYGITTKEITGSLHTRASFFITALETELQRIQKVHQEYLNDPDLYYVVNTLSIMSNYEKNTNLLSIEKRLRLIQDSSAYIEEATLYLPRLPKTISSLRGVVSAPDNWQALTKEAVVFPVSGLSFYEDSLYLCESYPSANQYSDYVPQYVLVIRISNERLMEDLKSFNLYPGSGTRLQSEDGLFWLQTGEDINIRENEFRESPWVRTLRTEDKKTFILVSEVSNSLNLQMYSYVSEQVIYSGLNAYRNLFLAFSIISLLLILAFFWFSRWLFSKPIRRLVASLRQVEEGNLDVRIEYQVNDEFGYLYKRFNHMTKSLANMLEMNTRQVKLTQEAELRQLQAQINPHFLHNCFYLLYRMLKDEDYENVSQLFLYLSDYYQYVTRNARMEVNLSDEDAHARRYVQIQLVRFGRRISADFEPLPGNLANLKVPRLILQPLVENAFQHGFENTITGGRLRVWYEEQKDKLCIHVEDNGTGIPEEDLAKLQSKLQSAANTSAERTGIVNIHQRLCIRYGPGYGLEVENLPQGGARFSLILPKNFEEAEYVSGIGS